MVAPRALVFRPLVTRNEDSGNEIYLEPGELAKPGAWHGYYVFPLCVFSLKVSTWSNDQSQRDMLCSGVIVLIG